MYKLYFYIYIISTLVYLVLNINIFNLPKNINNLGCCIVNDLLFYLNFILYILIVSRIFKENKIIYAMIGIAIIIIRYTMINYNSNFFARYFGYKTIEYNSNRIFYKLIDNDDNILKNIYSNYGPLINNIEFDSHGVHGTNSSSNIIQRFLFDTGISDKSENVKTYLLSVLNVSIDNYRDEYIKIIEYLDRKYIVAKAIWSIILISILFCLSLKYI